jgi:hypothetical protein
VTVAYAEVTISQKLKEKQAFLLYFIRLIVNFGLRRSYYLSEIKRKTGFSFVFHSFNRNFVA